MDIESYVNLISNSDSSRKDVSEELKTIIKKYPFFHSARALYLKNLKNKQSFRYNKELKLTAAHTMNRTVLFEFITSELSNDGSKVDREFGRKTHSFNISDKKERYTTHGKPSFEKTVSFSKNQTHTFLQWLQISTNKPIESEKSITKTKKSFIIDSFIEKNPKIASLKKYHKEAVKVPENKSDSSLMTETLANLYLEQKKFTKAIWAYEILSLKYPEKNSFFAAEIKKIKTLQSNQP